VTQPKAVAPLSEREGQEADEFERYYTSTISAVGDRGREIYIYLEQSDSLEWRDQRPPTDPSYIRVHVDMKGHRHWSVHLAPNDTMDTGRILPPPPPPPPPGGGGS